MSINGSNRTAGGGFTLPQHAFIPHGSTQPFGGGDNPGRVEHPAVNSGMVQPQTVFAPAANVHGLSHMFSGSTHTIIGGK